MTQLKSGEEESGQRTHPTPMETMCDGVFGLVRIWCHPFVDMLDLCTIARTTLAGTAITDMYVSAHRRANKVTHHRCSLVIRGELATSQLESSPVWSVNCPTGLRHGAMASFVFLLGMALKYRTITISICLTLWCGTLPRGKVQK